MSFEYRWHNSYKFTGENKMGQIPVKDELMPALNVLKTKALVARGGKSCVWSDIQSAMLKTTMKHEDEFIEHVKKADAITRPRRINEAIAQGVKVTSEDIKDDIQAIRE